MIFKKERDDWHMNEHRKGDRLPLFVRAEEAATMIWEVLTRLNYGSHGG